MSRTVRIVDCAQGDDLWWATRCGVPSVSNLSRILTPAKLEYSKGARGYASELIGERLFGANMDRDFDSLWTAYGKEGEDFARKWYEYFYDVDVAQVGSITTEVVRVDKSGDPVVDEDGSHVTDLFLGSPDGLVGDDGLLEVKCPKATTHMQYLTGHKSLSDEYHPQTQGYLWLTGRKWCDLISFNPDLPKKRVRIYPEEPTQNMIGTQLERFFREMALAERKLREMGDVIEEDTDLEWDLSESVKEGAA